jgi:acyl-CoA reductase-like NAD-dependent aldehyde dehydrogenase
MKSFTTEEEAMRVSNDSQYGLAAAVFTADLVQFVRFQTLLFFQSLYTSIGPP